MADNGPRPPLCTYQSFAPHTPMRGMWGNMRGFDLHVISLTVGQNFWSIGCNLHVLDSD